jgi:hypothetical protein
MPFPRNCIKLLEGPNVPSITAEELLMFVEESAT